MSSTLGQYLTDVTFASLNVAEETKRGIIEVLGYTNLSAVQAASLPPAVAGYDLLARAKTGTGKTIAFLVPAIQVLVAARPHRNDISVLAISPTRELASQISKEASALLKFHPFETQVVVGGTNMKAEQKRLAEQRCDILVATPGRLIDHLTQGEITVGRSRMDVRAKCARLRCLILDEADQLLEMGFRQEIEKVLALIPKERQTLLFSATVPEGIRQIAGMALRPHAMQYVDTIGEQDQATLAHVEQRWAACSMEDQFATIYTLLQQQCQIPNYKIIVFLVTARQTQHCAEVFAALGVPSLEIHSRKSQSARTKTSEQFRKGSNLVLFSSDVSARGMDYPDITRTTEARHTWDAICSGAQRVPAKVALASCCCATLRRISSMM